MKNENEKAFDRRVIGCKLAKAFVLLALANSWSHRRAAVIGSKNTNNNK